MSTPEFEVHRAIVHYSNPTTGEAHVRIPSLLGAGQTVTIPTTGLTSSDGFWNVPSIGSSTFIAVSADRTQFLWLTAIGVAGSGGDDPSNEPIGHEDRTASYIAFDNGTRTFSIQPANGSYVVWCVGLRYEKTTLESIQIPDTTGLYYISFDAQGQLQYSTDYFVWDQDCPTAYIYWNSTTQRAEFFADERHGITMDWQTHEYLHRTRGAAYANGFDASNFDTSTQDGNTDAQAKLDIDNGTFFDEDLQVDVRHSLAPAQNTWEQQLQGPARIPVFYKIGTGWKYDAPTDFPVKQGTTHPVYNRTSDWSVQELGANSYGVQWIVATNQLNYPILSIMGQTQYANVGQAESASWADMDLDGLPIVEIRVLYKIIFRATGSNTPGCYFEQIDDYRNALSNATSTAAAVVDHGNLTGLADNDHPQYAVAGSDGQIQYNNGGSFAGSSSLTFDDTSGKVTTNILQLATGPDVNGSGGGSLRLGNYGSQASMALDANEIQAFNSSGNPSGLNLNIVGGNVAFGSSASPGSHTANGDLTATGYIRAETGGADGGIVLGQAYSSSHVGLRTNGMGEASQDEYVILSDGTNTFVSSGSGGAVYLRGPANDSFNEIIITASGITVDGTTTFTDNVEVSGTTPILTLTGSDASYAEVRAHGTSQGTGAVFVGQSSTYGGGIFYNGDGSPSYATGEAADRVSFFRRSNGTNEVVFSYAYNTNSVNFRGNVDVDGSLTFPNGSINSTGYVTLDRGFVTNDFEVSGTLTVDGGINGLTLGNGISGSNFDITGVNQMTINDEGEGILFPNVSLYQEPGDTDRLRLNGNLLIVDDAPPHLTIRDSNNGDRSGYIAFEDSSGTRLGYIGYGDNDDIHIKNENSGGNIFFNTSNTWRAYFNTSGHFVPYVDKGYTLGTSSLRWGQLYASSVNLSGLIDVNWVRNTNGNFLALEGGDTWDLGNNASGEYVWVAAEGGLMIVSSDANSTSWGNRNQIRITPEGGVDQRLKIHGGLEVEGPDGGGVIRNWQAGSAYVMFGTANMTSQEYSVLTDGINTYISAGSGGSVYLRGGNNDTTPQLVVSNSAITCDNGGLTIDQEINQNGTGVNNFYAESKFRYVSTSNDWSAQPVQEISSQDCGYATRSYDSDASTGQLRAASGIWYCRSHNDGSYWTLAAVISNQSSYRMKQDIETWGHMKPLSSAVNADYDTTAIDLVRQLRPVSYRFNKQDRLPRDLPSERRQDALDRLNRIRLKQGEKQFDSEEVIHECGRDCDQSVDDPCVMYRQWERGTIGFIAEEVGEIIPEVTDMDVRPRSTTQGQNTAIDALALTAVLTKAIQEVDARLSALESTT